MRILVTIGFLLYSFSSFSFGSKDYLKYFPEQIVRLAADSQNLSDYSSMEQEVFMLTNLARMAPGEFSEMLTAYVSASPLYKSNNTYVISLKKELAKARPVLQPLKSHAVLKGVALSHAEYGKKTGKYGHQNIQQRALTVKNKMQHLSYSENCSYHYTNALDIFMSLLIDEGIKDLGHRKTILNPRLTHLGVAILPMKNPKEYLLIQSFSSK